MRLVLALILGISLLAGCGEKAGPDLSKVETQPPADLEAGKNAQTISEWAAANPNNGAPGSGEDGGK